MDNTEVNGCLHLLGHGILHTRYCDKCKSEYKFYEKNNTQNVEIKCTKCMKRNRIKNNIVVNKDVHKLTPADVNILINNNLVIANLVMHCKVQDKVYTEPVDLSSIAIDKSYNVFELSNYAYNLNLDCRICKEINEEVKNGYSFNLDKKSFKRKMKKAGKYLDIINRYIDKYYKEIEFSLNDLMLFYSFYYRSNKISLKINNRLVDNKLGKLIFMFRRSVYKALMQTNSQYRKIIFADYGNNELLQLSGSSHLPSFWGK